MSMPAHSKKFGGLSVNGNELQHRPKSPFQQGMRGSNGCVRPEAPSRAPTVWVRAACLGKWIQSSVGVQEAQGSGGP